MLGQGVMPITSRILIAPPSAMNYFHYLLGKFIDSILKG
jgi:hypothetical protein